MTHFCLTEAARDVAVAFTHADDHTFNVIANTTDSTFRVPTSKPPLQDSLPKYPSLADQAVKFLDLFSVMRHWGR